MSDWFKAWKQQAVNDLLDIVKNTWNTTGRIDAAQHAKSLSARAKQLVLTYNDDNTVEPGNDNDEDVGTVQNVLERYGEQDDATTGFDQLREMHQRPQNFEYYRSTIMESLGRKKNAARKTGRHGSRARNIPHGHSSRSHVPKSGRGRKSAAMGRAKLRP